MNNENLPVEQANLKPALADDHLYESWERLEGETAAAYAAFCVYRDCGLHRAIRMAVETVENDPVVIKSKTRSWRNWASKYRWRERAADYDRFIEKLKQAEIRKTYEAEGEKKREVTAKILDVISKKLDTMNPAELSQGNLPEWFNSAAKAVKDDALMFADFDKAESKQGEINFTFDFDGL